MKLTTALAVAVVTVVVVAIIATTRPSPYVGTWQSAKGETLTLRPDGTGLISDSAGPPADLLWHERGEQIDGQTKAGNWHWGATLEHGQLILTDSTERDVFRRQ